MSNFKDTTEQYIPPYELLQAWVNVISKITTESDDSVTNIILTTTDADGNTAELEEVFVGELFDDVIHTAVQQLSLEQAEQVNLGNPFAFITLMEAVRIMNLRHMDRHCLNVAFKEQVEEAFSNTENHEYSIRIFEAEPLVVSGLPILGDSTVDIVQGNIDMVSVERVVDGNTQYTVYPKYWKHANGNVPIASIVEHKL